MQKRSFLVVSLAIISLYVISTPGAYGDSISDDGDLIAGVFRQYVLFADLRKGDSSVGQKNQPNKLEVARTTLHNSSSAEGFAGFKGEVRNLVGTIYAETEGNRVLPLVSIDFGEMPRDATFLPGTHTLCILSPKRILLLDMDSDRAVRIIPLSPMCHAGRLAGSPDGKRIAFTDSRGKVRIIDVESGMEIYNLEGVYHSPHAQHEIAYDSSGELLATVLSGGNSIGIWDVKTGRLKGKLTLPKDEERSSVIEKWPLPTKIGPHGEDLSSEDPFVIAMSSIASVIWLPKTRLVVVGKGQKLFIFDTRIMDLVKVVKIGASTEGQPWSMSATRNGEAIGVVQDHQKVTMWSALTGEHVKNVNLPGFSKVPYPCIHFSNKDQLFVHSKYGFGQKLVVIDLETGKTLYEGG